jgi:hypothetical protein
LKTEREVLIRVENRGGKLLRAHDIVSDVVLVRPCNGCSAFHGQRLGREGEVIDFDKLPFATLWRIAASAERIARVESTTASI